MWALAKRNPRGGWMSFVYDDDCCPGRPMYVLVGYRSFNAAQEAGQELASMLQSLTIES